MAHVQGCGAANAAATTRSRRSTPVSGASAPSRSPTTTTRSPGRSPASRSRPARRASGATPRCCRSAPRDRETLTAGLDAARPGRPPRGRARPRRALDQGRHPQPDELVQGPGGRGRAGARRSSSATRPSRARPPATSPTRSRRPRPAPASTSYVFVPSDLESAKILTTSVYGGNVVAIDGNYDDVNRLCAEIADEHQWAFVNINVRPFYAEGSKTIAFETAEQLGWQTPDHVVVPIGSGSLLTKIRKGFEELHTGRSPRRGTRDRGSRVRRPPGARRSPPRSPSSPTTSDPVQPSTIAKSLAIGNPGRRLLRARRDPRRPAARRRP